MVWAESRAAHSTVDAPDRIVNSDCLAVVLEVAGSFGLSNPPGMDFGWEPATPFFAKRESGVMENLWNPMLRSIKEVISSKLQQASK
jgi:hypothetical protein